jgi:dihydrofolate synthase/folylpolyglutamate synthase
VAARLTYEEAERYLRSLELFGMRFGLDRMRRLMTALGSPNERLDAVQVVGTNGKSSTTRMVAAILRASGLRAGAYLSPHLGSFAERIEIDGVPLSRGRFAAALSGAARAASLVDRTHRGADPVTQFEALTAAAYSEIERTGVDAAVVEAGLGGRYDATSVIVPRVLAITNVGLEHTRWLGPTERHVAEEKLALLPEGGLLVAGALGADARAVAEELVSERDARLVLRDRDFELVDEGETFAVRTATCSYDRISLRPAGGFQRANFAVATAVAESFLALRGHGLGVEDVRAAALRLVLPGRLEVVGEDPLIVIDGAHNPDAARALADSLPAVVGSRPVVAVVSVLDDKDAAGMLAALLPRFRAVVFTRSSHERVLPPATLASLTRQLSGTPAEIVADPAAALERARDVAGPHGAVLVTGSIHLLSDLVRSGEVRASVVA